MQTPQGCSRRVVLAGVAAGMAGRARAAPALPSLRLGILPFGSVHWVADTMRRHALDTAHGFVLRTTPLANGDAAHIALLSRSLDIAVTDWPFVAAQRARGATLTFAPFSSASGGIMVPQASPVRRLADLAGLRLGVAGGPTDKSWLLVQAAARAQGLDLAQAARLSYGAPPLLGGLLQKGALDAALLFWPNAARLEAAGLREAITVAACAQALGLPATPMLVGYVFDAQRFEPPADRIIDGFLAASTQAADLLAHDPAEWQAVRPLMDAPGDALFAALRRRFIEGVRHPTPAEQAAESARVVQALNAASPKGAPPLTLPPGLFWPGANAG